MATQNNTPNPDPTFKHNCTLGADGEILYDCPMEIRDQQDLRNYGITWNDCKTLNFNGSAGVVVYFFRTTNRALADYQWTCLDTQHSRAYAANRCMVPGKRKAQIRCPDTNSCASCPYGRKPEDRQPAVISWNTLTETGYEPVSEDNAEEKALSRIQMDELKVIMDREDTRIWRAIELKERYGCPVNAIALDLNVSEPRVYQLIARAKAIGKAYRNSEE